MATSKTGIRNLILKGNTYWFQTKVPADLKVDLGKTNYQTNLHTSCIRTAKRRLPKARADAEAFFVSRRRGSPSMDCAVLSTHQDHVSVQIAQRAADWREADVISCDGPDLEMKDILISEEAERLEQEHGEAVAVEFYNKATGTAFDSYIEDWNKDVRVAVGTEKIRRRAVTEFAAHAKSPSLSQVNRAMVTRYKNHLRDIQKNGRVTINNKITMLLGYWKWMVKQGHTERANPFQDHRIPKPSHKASKEGEGKKRPYTDSELRALLKALQGHRDIVLHDFVHIGALTGMRIGEIAELKVGWCVDGVFDIQDSKSEAGERVVPIHSKLMPIVAKRIKGKKPEAYLFPEVSTPAAGTPRGDSVGKRFGRLRDKVLGEHKPKGVRQSNIDMHSLRRWFITKAEEADQPVGTIASVVGHKRAGETHGRYSGGPSIAQRRVCVEAVKLPINAPA